MLGFQGLTTAKNFNFIRGCCISKSTLAVPISCLVLD